MKLVGDDHSVNNVDLNDIRIARKVGGTIDETELVDGLVLGNKVARVAGGPTRVKDAKIGTTISLCYGL